MTDHQSDTPLIRIDIRVHPDLLRFLQRFLPQQAAPPLDEGKPPDSLHLAVELPTAEQDTTASRPKGGASGPLGRRWTRDEEAVLQPFVAARKEGEGWPFDLILPKLPGRTKHMVSSKLERMLNKRPAHIAPQEDAKVTPTPATPVAATQLWEGIRTPTTAELMAGKTYGR